MKLKLAHQKENKMKLKRTSNIIFIILLFGFFITPNAYSEECFIGLDSVRSDLEDALNDCQKQIQETEKVLQKQQVKRTNTEFDILLIDQEINKALLRVRSSDLILNELSQEIGSISGTVESLSKELTEQQLLLSTLLQRINETEKVGLFNFILTDISLSSFFFKDR